MHEGMSKPRGCTHSKGAVAVEAVLACAERPRTDSRVTIVLLIILLGQACDKWQDRLKSRFASVALRVYLPTWLRLNH